MNAAQADAIDGALKAVGVCISSRFGCEPPKLVAHLIDRTGYEL